jgi:hypothetical protein
MFPQTYIICNVIFIFISFAKDPVVAFRKRFTRAAEAANSLSDQPSSSSSAWKKCKLLLLFLVLAAS